MNQSTKSKHSSRYSNQKTHREETGYNIFNTDHFRFLRPLKAQQKSKRGRASQKVKQVSSASV